MTTFATVSAMGTGKDGNQVGVTVGDERRQTQASMEIRCRRRKQIGSEGLVSTVSPFIL